MEYEISLAAPRHVVALPEVERAAGRLFSPDDLPEELRDLVIPVAELREAQQAGQLWVACCPGDQPVGFGLVKMLAGLPHLEELSVDPQHGRRGVGTSLVGAICAWARSGGHASLTLTTFGHVPWNRPFYERLGFRVLADDELTPALRRVLDAESEEGLDASKRVAMRYGCIGS
jgi:GNAT superfamily N-acetyltransferase